MGHLIRKSIRSDIVLPTCNALPLSPRVVLVPTLRISAEAANMSHEDVRLMFKTSIVALLIEVISFPGTSPVTDIMTKVFVSITSSAQTAMFVGSDGEMEEEGNCEGGDEGRGDTVAETDGTSVVKMFRHVLLTQTEENLPSGKLSPSSS